MFGSFDTSTSALSAYRVRMDIIAGNMANLHTTRNAAGQSEPYQRRVALFAAGAAGSPDGRGVRIDRIVNDPSPPRLVHDPGHPDAQREGPDAGYVYYPNVNPVVEMVDMIAATRAYEANVTAFEAAKTIMGSALRLIA